MNDKADIHQKTQAAKAYQWAQAPLTIAEIENATEHRLELINTEFAKGFDMVKKYPRSVTFFGSARCAEGDKHYDDARALGFRIASELGYAVTTGGGPGIMEAGSRGAFEAKGDSIAFTIKLPMEQVINSYLSDYREFRFFFTRKVLLAFSAEAYVFFPGGFGTLDEFFEILTLVQTRKIPQVPIILMGTDYWNPLDAYIEKVLLTEHAAIDAADRGLYCITDSLDEALEVIRKAPMRRE
jgi:uncharacterized protein (TIGR00730 family)